MPIRLAMVIAVLTLLTAALTATFAGLFSAMARTVPEEFALCLGLLPANTPQCLSVMVTAALARWVYDTHAKIALEVGGGSLI